MSNWRSEPRQMNLLRRHRAGTESGHYEHLKSKAGMGAGHYEHLKRKAGTGAGHYEKTGAGVT